MSPVLSEIELLRLLPHLVRAVLEPRSYRREQREIDTPIALDPPREAAQVVGFLR